MICPVDSIDRLLTRLGILGRDNHRGWLYSGVGNSYDLEDEIQVAITMASVFGEE
jgi:hypothetical protein